MTQDKQHLVFPTRLTQTLTDSNQMSCPDIVCVCVGGRTSLWLEENMQIDKKKHDNIAENVQHLENTTSTENTITLQIAQKTTETVCRRQKKTKFYILYRISAFPLHLLFTGPASLRLNQSVFSFQYSLPGKFVACKKQFFL